jgi:two-component system cell cycle sensor histidine kinase/response regulator CckA
VRAATLTRQLLAFSRRQVLDLRTLNLNQIIQNMQPMVERLVGPNIRVQAQLAPELGAIRADAGQIEQVIINLAVNARDAMPNGGSLLLETSDLVLDQPLVVRRIEIPPGRYVTLSVTDTGVGMDEATQERIFEPFFTTKAPGQGTGLGLATAHGIVAQSGGQIWFESRAKSGTTFTICLPSIALPAAAAERPQPQPGAPNHETILLVDDDPSIRQIAAIALERHGFQVIQASAEEAEQIGQDKTRTLNLLLTDVIMPGIDGVELAHRLGLVRPELKVLYISGYTDSIIVQRGVSAGSAAFLQKPFTPSALVEKVREVLDT